MTSNLDWTQFKAALFDLDGVITRTANLHAAAWKWVFDDYLSSRGDGQLQPFDEQDDYHRYVDGKLREDGVASFLASRGLQPNPDTVSQLAQQKDACFSALLEERGVDVYEDGVAFFYAVRSHHLKTAVVSASRHCKAVLAAAKLATQFDVIIDGVEIRRLNLKGKPDPAAYSEAAKRLHVASDDAIVLEDALAGVQAGRRGNFGLVIGVDRANQASALHTHGAHLVVADLRCLLEGHSS